MKRKWTLILIAALVLSFLALNQVKGQDYERTTITGIIKGCSEPFQWKDGNPESLYRLWKIESRRINEPSIIRYLIWEDYVAVKRILSQYKKTEVRIRLVGYHVKTRIPGKNIKEVMRPIELKTDTEN